MDTKELEKDWLNTLRDDTRKSLREAKIGFTGLGIVGNTVQVKVTKPEDLEKATTALKKLILPISNSILSSGGNDITVEYLRHRHHHLSADAAGHAASRVERIDRRHRNRAPACG